MCHADRLQTWHRPRTQGIRPESADMMLVSKPKLRGKVGVKSGVKSTLYAAYSGLFPDPGVISIGEKLRDIGHSQESARLFMDLRNSPWWSPNLVLCPLDLFYHTSAP